MSSEVWVIWAGVSALSVPKPVPQPQWAGGAHRLPRALAKVYAWLLFRYREGAAGVSSRMGAGELHLCDLVRVTLECRSGYQAPISFLGVGGGERVLHSNEMLEKG